jgi:hypothetical protein
MLITRYNNIRGPICHYTVTYATAQGRLVAPREARPSATNQSRYHSSISICGTTSHCYDTQLIRRFVPMTKRKSRETVTPDRTVSISRGFRKRPRFHGRSESRPFGFPGVPLKPAFHEYAAERHCFLVAFNPGDKNRDPRAKILQPCALLRLNPVRARRESTTSVLTSLSGFSRSHSRSRSEESANATHENTPTCPKNRWDFWIKR